MSKCEASDPVFWTGEVGGLTKREYFAGLVLAQLASLTDHTQAGAGRARVEHAQRAVEWADALIMALNK